MNSPSVSVILPVYNSEKFLEESIDSILTQTYSDYELIIIDDNSSDNSNNIIKNVLKKNKLKKKILNLKNNQNLGVSKTLNKGFCLAKGKFIARMDADDVCHPTRLGKQINFLNNNPEIGLVGTNCLQIDENGRIIGVTDYPLRDKDIKAQFYFHNPFNHQSIFFRKNLFTSKLYNESFSTTQDYELYMRFMKRTKVANLKEKLVKQRIHITSVSVKRKTEQLKNTILVQKKYYRLNLKKRFDFDKFNKLNKYFLGDRNNFMSNGIEISSTCIDVLSIYAEIQKIEQNKCLENFFSSRFLLFLYYSFGEKHWVVFFKSVLKNFKVVNLFIISLRLISRKVKKKCAVY